MSQILTFAKKAWLKKGNSPVMANSDWCDDWKKKHPGNCKGCPQEQNCGDFAKMMIDVAETMLDLASLTAGKTKPCPDCGAELVKRDTTTLGGDETFDWCPDCKRSVH